MTYCVCVHMNCMWCDDFRAFLALIELAKARPICTPALCRGKSVRPLLPPPTPFQLSYLPPPPSCCRRPGPNASSLPRRERARHLTVNIPSRLLRLEMANDLSQLYKFSLYWANSALWDLIGLLIGPLALLRYSCGSKSGSSINCSLE